MFDLVRNNRRLVQLFLALITLPFAFWGVESYVRNVGAGNDVASVGGSKISPQEFQQALQAQQDRMRSTLGPRATPELLDSPEMRRSVLDSLIDQRLLAVHAAKERIGVSDDQLAQFLASVPALQENGKFSRERYEAVVAAQGLSSAAFNERLRRDLTLQQLAEAVGDASFAGRLPAERWLAAMLEEREVADASLKPEQYAGQVKLPPDAGRTYYDSHKKEFETPEQVKAEYLVFSQNSIEQQINVSDDEIKAWYAAHADQYKQPEQRRASHILITVDKNAPAAVVDAAKAKAEQILAEVRKQPSSFATLARQHSQDPGSAQKGGDLDWFGRGAMVKVFDDAVFSMKEGQISDLVRSDFGYHIIQLTGVRPEHVRALDEVRAEIAGELRKQAAAKKYNEQVEAFSNTVYEQADSLQPAADKFGLKIEKSDWLARGASGNGLLANPKLLTALFSDDAIKNKRNTEAVEVAPGTMVSARVTEHQPAAVRPFDEVRAAIEKKLTLDEAAKLARKDGEDKLARLAKGEPVELKWSQARGLTRMGAQDVPPPALKEVFKVDSAKLPGYAGAVTPDGGYTLYRITQVKPYQGGDDPRATMLREQYARIAAGEEFAAWMAALRKRYPVEINAKALEAKER